MCPIVGKLVLWNTPSVPAFSRQKQVDLGEIEVSLVNIVSSRTALPGLLLEHSPGMELCEDSECS